MVSTVKRRSGLVSRAWTRKTDIVVEGSTKARILGSLEGLWLDTFHVSSGQIEA